MHPVGQIDISQEKYELALSRRIRRLKADPVNEAERVGGITLRHEYTFKERETKIHEALVLWVTLYQGSSLFVQAEHDLRRKFKQNFRPYLFEQAVRVIIKEQLAALRETIEASKNEYVRAVAMFMLLPERVARRWLWHKNIDFQSLESFLRRLTPSQMGNLEEHYRLIGTCPDDELPCFQEGRANRVWKKLGLPDQHLHRMAKKSALAYNFFGFDMGFQMYPNENEDGMASLVLAKQFLSSRNRILQPIADPERGSFEVNMEYGGLYWYLYRTMRSNSVWNSDADVTLGRWICPGFWITMLGWLFFLIVSPACLFVALGFLLSHQAITLPVAVFGIPGLFTPLFFIVRWVKSHLNEGVFGGDYWSGAAAVFVVILLAFVFNMIFYKFGDCVTFYVILLGAIVVVPYVLKEESARIWNLPYFGKPIVFAVIASFAQDIYRFTNFWEGLWSFMVWIYARIAEHAMNIGIVALIAAFYGVLFVLIRKFDRARELAFQKVTNRDMLAMPAVNTREIAEKTDQYYHVMDRVVMLSVPIICIVASYAWGSYFGFNVNLAPMLFVSVILSLMPLAMHWDNAKNIRTYWMHEKYDMYPHSLSRSERKLVVQYVSENPYWFDGSAEWGARKELRSLLDFAWQDNKKKWVIHFIREVTNDTQLSRVMEFLESDASRYDFVEHIAPYVLDGLPIEEITPILKAEHMRRNSMSERIDQMFETFVRRVSRAWGFIVGVVHKFLSPIRMTYQFLRDCYRWAKSMAEYCPPSPERNRSTLN